MTEREIAVYEAARNKASGDYFRARPQLASIQNLEMFEAGFERAWNLLKQQNKGVQIGYGVTQINVFENKS